MPSDHLVERAPVAIQAHRDCLKASRRKFSRCLLDAAEFVQRRCRPAGEKENEHDFSAKTRDVDFLSANRREFQRNGLADQLDPLEIIGDSQAEVLIRGAPLGIPENLELLLGRVVEK